MTVPIQLDTSRPDWRRQARSTGKCKSCEAKILWMVWHDEAGNRDRWAPYDFETGALHHKDCPAREQYRTYREDPRPQAAAALPPSVSTPPTAVSMPHRVSQTTDRQLHEQLGLFGSPTRYGTD